MSQLAINLRETLNVFFPGLSFGWEHKTFPLPTLYFTNVFIQEGFPQHWAMLANSNQQFTDYLLLFILF